MDGLTRALERERETEAGGASLAALSDSERTEFVEERIAAAILRERASAAATIQVERDRAAALQLERDNAAAALQLERDNAAAALQLERDNNAAALKFAAAALQLERDNNAAALKIERINAAAALQLERDAAFAQAKEMNTLLDRTNPFLVSHHSDSVSGRTSGFMPPRFPAPHDNTKFKRTCANWYGLMSTKKGHIIDMLGLCRPISEVTLAHIWPASYTNWGEICGALALPPEFYKEPRNFLLLPRELHELFDHGHIIFVPSRDRISIRLLSYPSADGKWPPHLKKLEGLSLHLPLQRESRVPYKRVLAYFALVAKDEQDASSTLDSDLIDACSASDSEDGNRAALEMEKNLEKTGRLKFGRTSIAAAHLGAQQALSKGIGQTAVGPARAAAGSTLPTVRGTEPQIHDGQGALPTVLAPGALPPDSAGPTRAASSAAAAAATAVPSTAASASASRGARLPPDAVAPSPRTDFHQLAMSAAPLPVTLAMPPAPPETAGVRRQRAAFKFAPEVAASAAAAWASWHASRNTAATLPAH